MSWHAVAARSLKRSRALERQWPFENLLLEHAVEGDADAAKELEQLLRDRAATVTAARSSGGAKAARRKERIAEERVVRQLSRLESLPEPRRLVGTLVGHGLRRDTVRAALRRLAAAGKLPEQYAQHFR